MNANRTLRLFLLVIVALAALPVAAGPAAAYPELAKHTFHDDLSNVQTRYWNPVTFAGPLMRPAPEVGQELVIPTNAPTGGGSNFGAILYSPKRFTIKPDSFFTMQVDYRLLEWVNPSDVRVVLQIHFHDLKGKESHNIIVGRTWIEGEDDVYFLTLDGQTITQQTDDWNSSFHIERDKHSKGIEVRVDGYGRQTLKVGSVGAIDWTLAVVGSNAYDRAWPVRAVFFGFDIWSEKGFNTPGSWKK